MKALGALLLAIVLLLVIVRPAIASAAKTLIA